MRGKIKTMGLKENIKKRRLDLNLTLEEVSNKLSVSKPTLQRYESGVISNIPSDKIEKLAAILETTPAYLMGWEEEKIDIKSQLTEEEKSLLDKYNSLDYVGKHTVNTVLEMEFKRCN
ncbi:helix-turn-helix transcriptional regulator [Clostridium sp. DL-VIII]|uniref:helix-turn-helix domain-containing protein n=1 Tax=Clostridium sp. DL-VIII TaxID=641107 RepID=UPI001FA6C89D|nr:helix-turn-helix transcriptional regulator [Clostridium sp. DL-VIII]